MHRAPYKQKTAIKENCEARDIILVDDDEVIRTVLARHLTEEGYRVTQAASGEEMQDILTRQAFDIALLDIHMPGIDGLSLLQEIKPRLPDLEVIIITAKASLDSAVTALRAGAYDYLSKPFNNLAIVSAVVRRASDKIRAARVNISLIENLRQSNNELEKLNTSLKNLAVRDSLTGIYNRRYFQDFLEMELSRSLRKDCTFSLLFLDVDEFKKYNDTHGHVAGDALLCSLANIVKNRLRKMDLVARYGGEEFVALLPDTDLENAMRLAEDVRQHIESNHFSSLASHPSGRITVSIGVSSFPHDGTDAISLIREADKSLYKAKAAGKNMVCRPD